MVLKATPLILIALGLAVCYRSNVWNIGAEGQFLLGALSGGGVALWLTTSGIVLPQDHCRAAGAGCQRARRHGLGGVDGAAARQFNASEILVSLMLVYVAAAAA